MRQAWLSALCAASDRCWHGVPCIGCGVGFLLLCLWLWGCKLLRPPSARRVRPRWWWGPGLFFPSGCWWFGFSGRFRLSGLKIQTVWSCARKCRHVRTHFQLADALTKSMEPDLIIEVLSTGKVMLQGDAPKKVTPVTKHETTSLVCQFRGARKQRKKSGREPRGF